MTRQEFVDGVTEWYELMEFCQDYGIEVCDDVIDEEDYESNVEDDICDRDCGWSTLRDCLNDLPEGDYSYYHRNGWLDYEGLDEYGDFRAYKQDVLDWMDHYGEWDEEEEDEEDEYDWYDEFVGGECDEEPEDDDEPVVEIDFAFVISSGQGHLQMLMEDAVKADEEDAALVDEAADLILSPV